MKLHTGPEEACPYCLDGSTPRWEAYLAVLPVMARRPYIAAITPYAYHTCPLLKQLDGRLRGHEITLQREHNHRNSKLIAVVSPEVTWTRPMDKLPDPDILAVLARWWGVPKIDYLRKPYGGEGPSSTALDKGL